MSPTGLGFVGGFIVAAALGVGWGLYQDAQAARERLAHEERLSQDSTDRAQLEEDLAAMRARLVDLRRDSIQQYLALSRAKQAAQAGLATIRTLLRAADSATGRTEHIAALDAVLEAGARCDEALAGCERRASVADSMARATRQQLDATAAVLDTTATRWRDATRQAAKRWYLGLTLGYGALLSGGEVPTGFGALVGITRVLHFGWPF